MEKFEISYKSEIVIGDRLIDPEGCVSICFENLGTKTAYILDTMPLDPMKIREFTNESNCVIVQKFKISYRQNYDRSSDVDSQQILITKTFAKKC